MNMLEADSILLEYGRRKILQNIYLKIEKGNIVGLLGRNGSGKSSLLEVIYGTRAAQNCSVRINKKYVSKLYQQPNAAAYLPQRQFVPGYLKVSEALRLYEVPVSEAGAYFPELQRMLPQRLNQLSGGEQRLIETIMVISCPAEFIMLDEPFSNLMPLHVERIKAWLLALKATKGILISDHYYRDVLALSDQVYLLNNGGRTILLQEPLQQLRDFGYIY
ncbi:ATP-binding cassette domain-containing protein [Dyadobacter sp. Leaf189]|uniref:ATP-binding cassette domain-containing protein n=1 Tax=Dyadobacter sp. Leaf189 TaxID=1736295 RepID=UPI000AE00C35|nr:ATP-binding cassette domain-containing protein [Dyadobacter sp. Leaf189]